MLRISCPSDINWIAWGHPISSSMCFGLSYSFSSCGFHFTDEQERNSIILSTLIIKFEKLFLSLSSWCPLNNNVDYTSPPFTVVFMALRIQLMSNHFTWPNAKHKRVDSTSHRFVYSWSELNQPTNQPILDSHSTWWCPTYENGYSENSRCQHISLAYYDLTQQFHELYVHHTPMISHSK